ncbi:MAG: hopanoid C-3 methylase HpnR, partial [Acidimicrobiales bacterium]
VDLQVWPESHLARQLELFAPQAVGFGLNYLANVPEVVDLAKAVKRVQPHAFVFVGGHSASFIADQLIEHGGGAIDAVVRGEGEVATPLLLDAVGTAAITSLPGVVTAGGTGPQPTLTEHLEDYPPARDIGGRRRRYFIGELDPAASIELSRGCPWDCSFCSAWTFYGRSYRKLPPEAAGDEMERIREPNVFLVDDVSFIKAEDGMAIAAEIERRNIHKRYYLETRSDVLIRNYEVFERWRRLGLSYMFLGIEAIDEEGLKAFRKRTSLDANFQALELARKLGIAVAVNIIVDPDWDEDRFRVVREWAMSVPEIVQLTVQTPYPGTETWFSERRTLTSRDYRLFDISHAVLPTRLPLERFYEELVFTLKVLARKHLGYRALFDTLGIAAGNLAHGQTNFVRMLWKFGRVFDASRLCHDHAAPSEYLMPPQPADDTVPPREQLYVHVPLRTSRRREAGEAASAGDGDRTQVALRPSGTS